MNLPEAIHPHVRALPADPQRGAFGFIGFLAACDGLAPAAPRLTTPGFIERFTGGLDDDFPAALDPADPGQDPPRESLG